MNIFNIERSFKQKRERNWEKTWWFIDLHDTICKADYRRKGKRTFHRGAKEVLQFLSKRKDIVLVLFSCSHRDSIKDALTWLERNKIHFDHVNENPDIGSDKLCNFSKKPYFNVMLDDKAGFEGKTDWVLVKAELVNEFGSIK